MTIKAVKTMALFALFYNAGSSEFHFKLLTVVRESAEAILRTPRGNEI